MKKIILIIILISFFYSCKENKTKIPNENSNIIFEYNILNDTILNIFNKYVDLYPSKIYRLYLSQSYNKNCIMISKVFNLKEIIEHKPNYYFIMNDNFFLVNTGIEYFVKSTNYNDTIVNLIKNKFKNFNDTLDYSSHTPIIWEISIEKNNFILNKNVLPPYSPPIVNDVIFNTP